MADIQTYDAPDQLTRAAADLVLDDARSAVRERGAFVLGLCGGSTAAMVYRFLADERYAARLPWEHTYIFWSDELWVPSDPAASNQRMASAELLDNVPIPRGHVRPIITLGVEPAESATVAGRHVRELFSGPPRPDLILLDLGEDGRTASLFPGSLAVLEDEALFVANDAPAQAGPRVTATFPLINAARHVVFVVSGATKAHAAQRVVYPKPDALALPASMVRPVNGKLTWLLDRDTAALLEHTDFLST